MRHCQSEHGEQSHRWNRVDENLEDHEQKRGHLVKYSDEKNAPHPEINSRERPRGANVVVWSCKEVHEHEGERSIEKIHEAEEV